MAYFDKYGVEYSDDRKILVRCPKDFEGEYIVPNDVLSIRIAAFKDCRNLKKITIPNSVKRIGERSFSNCTALSFIKIPFGVLEIGQGAFLDCTDLEIISLPESIEIVANSALYRCENLRKIIVPKGQKARFAKMDGLKNLSDKFVEDSEETNVSSMRTWGELEQLWFDMYREFEKQEGQVPSIMPPFGVCLTTAEFAQYKSEGRDFKKIHAWCWSGQEMHTTMRMHLNAPSMAKIGEPIVGPLTPRIGIYKVVRMDSDSLYCYYIGKDIRDEDNNFDFLEEIVEINPSPLYNYYSKGPKDYDIVTGDIIIVTDNQLKKLHLSDGKTYSITWRFGNPKN